jgi:hypothetical protein
LFFRKLFANRTDAFFALDVIASVIVLTWFIQCEDERWSTRLFFSKTGMLDRKTDCKSNDRQ